MAADDFDEAPASEELFNVAAFERFCSRLRIDAKEMGRIPLTLLGTQRYLIEQIAEGLKRGVHLFVVLKGRQIGISTVLLALDIYWMFKHRGMQGAIVTDTDDNKQLFRSHIELFIRTLPEKARNAITRHNVVQLLMSNRSRLQYMVAGTRKQKGDLGRAKSANYLHGTECSGWVDEEGFGSLMNTLAQKYPKRLYIFESTARGYNMFYQSWEVAKKSETQCAVFIGWWRNELYSWEPDSIEYKSFWTGELTAEERVWVGEVYEIYGIEITDKQIAWWRWYVADTMKGDEHAALQEMPPTENYAFQLSGSKYFSIERVNRAYQRALKIEVLYFRYEFGLQFEDTQFLPVEREEDAEVLLFATPVLARNPGERSGKYACGADPAYGSSEWADEHVGCLLRCYADKAIQVAEFASTEWTDQQFAWVLCHMCGWYGDVMLNLEMQGPGGAVFNEIGNLKRRVATFKPKDPRLEAFDVIGNVRDYLWKRQDTIVGNYAYQWQTNSKEKIRMMSTLRGNFEREIVMVSSKACIQQFRNIHRSGDQIGGEGRAKDDRVIALAIANVAYNDWLMLEMQAEGKTYEHEHRPEVEHQAYTPLERSLVNYLKKQSIHVPNLTPTG